MNRKDIRKISFAGFILAIILVMTFWPQFGFIQITPGIAITLIHIPVIIGAALLGKRYGLLFGAVFGIGSMIMAFVNISTNAPFTNPIVSILPRMFFGFIVVYVFAFFERIFRGNKFFVPVSFIVSTIIHSVVVLVILYFVTSSGFYFKADEYVFENVLEIIITILAVNASVEVVFAGLVGTPIYFALKHLEKRNETQPD